MVVLCMHIGSMKSSQMLAPLVSSACPFLHQDGRTKIFPCFLSCTLNMSQKYYLIRKYPKQTELNLRLWRYIFNETFPCDRTFHVILSLFNLSPQLSTMQLLAHFPPPLWDAGENRKSNSEKTRGLR